MDICAPDSVFVGRRTESALLAELFAAVTEGGAATVLLGGEAGIGKSRLVGEFIRSAEHDKVLMLMGAGVELGADGLPFAPFVAALRGLLTGPDRERFEPELRARPELAPLLPGFAGTATAGEDARPRLFEGLLGLLADLAAPRPLVLVIEDAHWADASSRDLLDFLVRNQRAAPGLLVLVTHRSDELGRRHPLRHLFAELDRLPWVRRLELARFSRREVAEQARVILGREPDPDLLCTVQARSEGNPLFVETLLACGEQRGVPASLNDLLLDRVDRLPEYAIRVVHAASVAGGQVGHGVLAAVSDVDSDTFTRAARTAVDANVLMVLGGGYGFRHALIREAVYHSLLPGERLALHAAYARALRECAGRECGGTRSSDDLSGLTRTAVELAHHLFAAGDRTGALLGAVEAADVARDSLAYAEQLLMLERVLELWEQLDDAAGLTGTEHATVLERAAEAAARAGAPVRGQELATLALAEIDRDAQPVRAGLLLEQRARMRAEQGRADALEDYRAAVSLVPDGHPARPYVLNALAANLLEIPDFTEAAVVAKEALEVADAAGDEPAVAAALISLAVLDAPMEGLEPQLAKLARAAEIGERAGAPRLLLRALHAESALRHGFGDLAGAEAAARRGLDLARQAGLARAAGGVHAVDLVVALYAAGRWDESRELVEQALEADPPSGYRMHLLGFKALIALHRGDLDTPERILASAGHLVSCDAALTLDRWLGPRLEIRLRLAQGRLPDAIAAVDRALTLPYLSGSRFTWPLLAIAAEVAAAAPDPALIRRLEEIADGLEVVGPVQRATALAFTATLRGTEREPWAATVTAWRPLGQPAPLAEALLGAARAAMAADGDRAAATELLREAAALADSTGAVLLRGAIDDLARRARLGLPGDTGSTDERLGLTPRELEILRLLGEGLGNKEIGARLFISAKTASVHVSNILSKLDVANRVEAAAVASRLGLLA